MSADFTKPGAKRDEVGRLADGTRTVAEIAAAMGVSTGYVRATIQRQGWQNRVAAGKAPSLPEPAEPTRADDERILGWLQDRCAGLSVAAIARAARCGASHVQTILTAVRAADMTESGEPQAEVLRGYQWGKAT